MQYTEPGEEARVEPRHAAAWAGVPTQRNSGGGISFGTPGAGPSLQPSKLTGAASRAHQAKTPVAPSTLVPVGQRLPNTVISKHQKNTFLVQAKGGWGVGGLVSQGRKQLKPAELTSTEHPIIALSTSEKLHAP